MVAIHYWKQLHNYLTVPKLPPDQANGRYPPLEEADGTYSNPGLPMQQYVKAAFDLLSQYKAGGKMCRTVECFLAGDANKKVVNLACASS